MPCIAKASAMFCGVDAVHTAMRMPLALACAMNGAAPAISAERPRRDARGRCASFSSAIATRSSTDSSGNMSARISAFVRPAVLAKKPPGSIAQPRRVYHSCPGGVVVRHAVDQRAVQVEQECARGCHHHTPCFRLASMSWSRSPSSTFCVLLISTLVRRSLMRLWSST